MEGGGGREKRIEKRIFSEGLLQEVFHQSGIPLKRKLS